VSVVKTLILPLRKMTSHSRDTLRLPIEQATASPIHDILS